MEIDKFYNNDIIGGCAEGYQTKLFGKENFQTKFEQNDFRDNTEKTEISDLPTRVL